MNKTDLFFWSWILFSIFFFAYSIKIWRNRINNYVNNRHYKEGKDLFSIYSEDFGLVLVKTVLIFLVTYFVFQSISHYYDNFHINMWFHGLFIIPLTFFLTATTLHLILYFRRLSIEYPLNFIENSNEIDPIIAYKKYNENFTKSLKGRENSLISDSGNILAVIALFLGAMGTSLLNFIFKDSGAILYIKKLDSSILTFIIAVLSFLVLSIISFFVLWILWAICVSSFLKLFAFLKKSSFDKFLLLNSNE